MIRVIEPLAWQVDLEPRRGRRQLRLVPDEIPPFGGDLTVGAATSPEGTEIAQSLASYLAGLGPGSQCCWCGAALVLSGQKSGFRMECRSCGALVERPESVHGADVRL